MNGHRESYFNYWGKTSANSEEETEWHPLVYHSLDVAAVGWVWLEKEPWLLAKLQKSLGFEESNAFRSLITFFLALHDLGKFADAFQGLNSDVRRALGRTGEPPVYRVRHDSLGYVLWQNCLLRKKGRWGGSYDGLIPEQDWFNTEDVREKIAWAEILNLLVQATMGHHGRPPVLPNAISLTSHFSEADIAATIDFCKDLFELFRPNFPVTQIWEEISAALKPLTFWLAGFSVVCDWLGSNAEIFLYRKESDLSLKEYFEQVAIAGAATALEKSGVLSSKIMPYAGANRLFDYLQSPTPLQKLCSDLSLTKTSGPSLYILEDVTGAGKTEAALILAQRQMETFGLKGFYIGLPTMATANGMYNRMREYYRKFYDEEATPSLVLAHGARNMHDRFQESILASEKADSNYRDEESATALCAAWIADSSKKSLLGDTGIGTIDQTLLAVLRSKFHTLRLFGLMHKVLILDEVHAYDSYMNELICELLAAEARSGAPVVLLSATLPFSLREKFCQSYAHGLGAEITLCETNQYPLLTQVSLAGIYETAVDTRAEVRRTVRVKFVHEEQDITSIIADAVEKNQCVCWLRNTVADAVAAYRSLKEQLGENVLLFHARFAMGDRLDIESRVLNLFGAKSRERERAGKVLIATQVVEQSLDLDFDVMITDLAPVDLVIQRAGRLHRHRRDRAGNPHGESCMPDGRDAPLLWIHAPEFSAAPDNDWYQKMFSKASFVYRDHGKLWLTAKWLAERNQLRMPDDARAMVEFVYGDKQDVPASLQDWSDAAEQKENIKESLAALNTVKFSQGYTAMNDADWDDLSAPSRYSEENSVKVVLGTMHDGVCVPIRQDIWSDMKWEHRNRTEQLRLWAESEVILPAYIAAAEDMADEAISSAVTRAREILPSKGKYAVFVVLSKNAIGHFGFVLNNKGQRINLLYSRERGIEW